MNTQKLVSAFFVLVTLTLTACDNEIHENDRFIPVEKKVARRAVLIEDFTAQRCVNCPDATDEIERLQEQYGKENVIAVGIHSGDLAKELKDGKLVPLPLWTETGQEYYNAQSIINFGQPTAIINRVDGWGLAPGKWSDVVGKMLETESPVTINIVNRYNDRMKTATINIEIMSNETFQNKHLQVWLVEDKVKGLQEMKNNVTKDDYIHNHVFRTAVNGTWGEAIHIEKGVATKTNHQLTLKEDWKVEDLSVVAFVYDKDEEVGVLQVAKKTLANF
ncbi:MAG: Omp28 family outer membrane lipoprotein [Prevotella sp.]|nr:Omp28 family outer membrane lipoprotein [Prevotella sp.]